MASQHPPTSRSLAIVTGASSGIGRELAILAAREGFDVIAAADTPLEEVTSELEAKVSTQENKADPAKVAKVGFEAMMKSASDVVAGMKNKLQVAMAGVTPKEVLAEQHRKMAEPGTASPGNS